MRYFSVRLPDGTVLDPEIRDQDAEHYRARLRGNRGRGAATCLCRAQVVGERQLSIRILKKGGRAVIARYPNTSGQHYLECYWHRDCDASNAYGYAPGVVKRSSGGIITVSYSTRIVADVGPEEPTAPKPQCKAPKSGVRAQPTISLGGLLALILEESGIANYDPCRAKRDWNFIALAVSQAANAFRVGARPLSSALVVGRLRNSEAAARTLFDEINSIAHEAFFTIGTMPHLPAPSGGLLPLLHADYGDLIIKIDGQQAQTLRRRFPKPAVTVQTRGIVIALVQPGRKKREAWVRDAAVIWTTDEHYIPVASSYEAIIANLLIDQKRKFTKPLRHNRAVGTFPDFLLLDVGSIPLPMEVFGRADPVYTKNRVRKMQFYADTYGSNWWSWDATSGDPPPPFPPSGWV